MTQCNVIPHGKDPVVQFAAEELLRHLKMGNADVSISTMQQGNGAPEYRCRIGLAGDLVPEVPFSAENRELDDGIYIDAGKEGAVIAGTNPRSTLIAVYRFLYELGFRWGRPGAEGVFVPEKILPQRVELHIRETASYRHRGVCIEGACSEKNILDMVDWLPKLGCNSYFLQFEDATVFLNRWYGHVNNPSLPDESKSPAETGAMTAEIIKEIKKRGLLLHAMGHGWTTKCMGLQDSGWEKSEGDSTIDWMLAQVDGKRGLFGGIPTNTNLCYSSPQVQERFAQAVVDYAACHPHVDYLHVWLADTYNNQCECEQCRTLTPTDWYVRILNRIDRQLTERGLPTRIVVLAYQELLWPPEKECLTNPDRFVLMFAPISRSFEKSCRQMGTIPEIPPYRRNRITLPERLEENVAFLQQWKQKFPGDSFDYDYHLGRAHYGDPGYAKISSVLAEDVKYLKNLDLNGMILCQEQRISFPTSLPNYIGGLLLWNKDLDAETICEDYYAHCFGDNWKACRRYLEAVSAAFDMDFWNGKKDVDRAQALEKLDAFLRIFPDVAEEALRPVQTGQHCQLRSHEILRAHREYVALFAQAIRCKLSGQDGEADRAWSAFVDAIRQHEMEFQPELDVYRVIEVGENYTGFSYKNQAKI